MSYLADHPLVDLMILDLSRAVQLSRNAPPSVKNALAIGSAMQSALSMMAHIVDDSAQTLRLWHAVHDAVVIALEEKLALPLPEDLAARDMCPRTLLALADELDEDAALTHGDQVHDLSSWMQTIARRYRRRAKLARGGWAAMRAMEERKRGQKR
jgi:hypothetical protein